MKVNFKEENSLYKKMSANFCYFRDYESEVGIFFFKTVSIYPVRSLTQNHLLQKLSPFQKTRCPE